MDVLDRMGHQGHPEEDHLERYVMRICSAQEAGVIEAHLPDCEPCRVRLYDAEEWVSLMKTALPLGPTHRTAVHWRLSIGQLFTRPGTLAAGCMALAAILVIAPSLLRDRAVHEEFVMLSATRGGPVQPPAGSSHNLLRLHLDVTGLEEPLDGQVVDESGGVVWSQPVTATNPEIMLDRPLKPGDYWVRVNSREQTHANLREFSLHVE